MLQRAHLLHLNELGVFSPLMCCALDAFAGSVWPICLHMFWFNFFSIIFHIFIKCIHAIIVAAILHIWHVMREKLASEEEARYVIGGLILHWAKCGRLFAEYLPEFSYLGDLHIQTAERWVIWIGTVFGKSKNRLLASQCSCTDAGWAQCTGFPSCMTLCNHFQYLKYALFGTKCLN